MHLGTADPLPSPDSAWDSNSPAPGLLALGGGLSVDRLIEAYGQATFPWYSDGQPVMWWSTDPRMTLHVDDFRLHKSLKKHIRQLRKHNRIEVRVDHDFQNIIEHCSKAPRAGQAGTWIVKDMIHAFQCLHHAGFAHSVETWIDNQLAGGLYCVSMGQAVFGESMFALQSNASKISLAALICICRKNAVTLIDCQQNTPHLASLGAKELTRADFLSHVRLAKNKPPIPWQFDDLYWEELDLN